MQLPGHTRNRADRSYRVDGPVVLLIGSGGMPVEAAKMMVRAGFDIAGLHSPDPPLREWADAQNHPHYFSDFAEFRAWGETIASDYLFSVRNLRLLPTSLIEAPLELAINYHDSPLPKYAGSHATAWALRNHEETHGITWHVMTEKVDAGDVLKQVTFPIPEGTTKDQLDQRCYLAAMRALRDLLSDLKAERYTRTPQDLRLRTFYPQAVNPQAQP
jgi:methionyl-tRNA formyltransferase